MKLILREDVTNLGEAGEVVNVKPGYARNFLLPRGLAYVASEANLQRIEEEKANAEERAKRDYLEARRRASQIDALTLRFGMLAGEDGKLFGSVTNADIAAKANESGLDFELDRRTVVLEEPLKSLGTFQVPVRLHAEVDVELTVEVEASES